MKNKFLEIFLIIVFSTSLVFGQAESFSYLEGSEITFTNNNTQLQLQLGTNPLYQKFSWQDNNFNNLDNTFSQDYILNFTLKPNAEQGIGFEGIIASDMGITERNMLGLYDQEDFSNKQFLIDQQVSYIEGDITVGVHFLDIPKEMFFSPNLRQKLIERYNEKKMENILGWQQIEYTINLGQEDADHLFLSYMAGEKQKENITGYNIDLSYNLFGELPINYIDSYHQDNERIISRDLLEIQKQFGDFSIEFLQSENYITSLEATELIASEEVDRLAIGGNFDFGSISYIDSYHKVLENGREISDSELGFDANFYYDSLSFYYSDIETTHTDSKNNQDILENIIVLGLTYDRLKMDRYLLSYSNRNGVVIKNGEFNTIDEKAYKIVYMINSDQKLIFDYLDSYDNQYSLHLSPIIKSWPIGLAYINKSGRDGNDMDKVVLTFPQKNMGFINIDAFYALQKFFILGDSENEEKIKEDIQINVDMGQLSLAAQKQKDEKNNLSSDSFIVGWSGESMHANWLYGKNNQQDSWVFKAGRQFGDDISADYQLCQKNNLQEHGFAFKWDIMQNMNFCTNLNLRDEELDSRKYSFNAQFLDKSYLILEYFLNPLNKRGQIQNGECYRLALNYNFSNDLGIQYTRSNMSFDSNENLLPTEEEGIRFTSNLGSLLAEVAYIQSIDKSLNDKGRIEYLVGGNLGDWGCLSFKLFDYKKEPNFFDISLEHKGECTALSFHAVSNPLELKEVDIGEEYQTFKYYLQYESEF